MERCDWPVRETSHPYLLSTHTRATTTWPSSMERIITADSVEWNRRYADWGGQSQKSPVRHNQGINFLIPISHYRESLVSWPPDPGFLHPWCFVNILLIVVLRIIVWFPIPICSPILLLFCNFIFSNSAPTTFNEILHCVLPCITTIIS